MLNLVCSLLYIIVSSVSSVIYLKNILNILILASIDIFIKQIEKQ